MSCLICGRSSCVPSFHSLEEQEAFDNVAEKIKSRILEKLEREKTYLCNNDGKDVIAVKWSDIEKILE